MTFDLEPEGITIGAIQVRFYSLMILSGAVAGILLARAEARRLGESMEHVVNIAAIGAVLGLVGARLYHVLDQQNWPFYQANPEKIIAVWNGGIGIFGAVAGALVGLLLYAYWKRLPVARWLDIGAPAFLLGQAIGRWGNFFNQELFGPPTNLPWGIPIDVLNRPFQYQDASRFHPLFLYESLLSLIGVAVLVYIARRFGPHMEEVVDAQGRPVLKDGVPVRRLVWRGGWRLLPGDVILLYFVWYPAERFGLEFLRITPWTTGGVPMAQWISGGLIFLAIGLLVWRHVRTPSDEDADQASQRSRAALRRQRRRMGEDVSGPDASQSQGPSTG